MERTALRGARQRRWVLHEARMETHTFEAQLWKIPALSEGVGLEDCYFYREIT